MNRARWESTVKRVAVVWVTMLALLSFGAQAGHWGLVPHTLCAAHGTLEHHDAAADDHHHAGSPDQSAQTTPEDQGDSTAGPTAGTSSVEGEHAHCDACLDAGQIEAPPALVVTHVIAWTQQVNAAPRQPSPKTRRYQLAPKTSPPPITT